MKKFSLQFFSFSLEEVLRCRSEGEMVLCAGERGVFRSHTRHVRTYPYSTLTV